MNGVELKGSGGCGWQQLPVPLKTNNFSNYWHQHGPKKQFFPNSGTQAVYQKTSCDFFHLTLAMETLNFTVEKEKTEIYKCVGYKCEWTDKSCVIEHVINYHRVYFCLHLLGTPLTALEI